MTRSDADGSGRCLEVTRMDPEGDWEMVSTKHGFFRWFDETWFRRKMVSTNHGFLAGSTNRGFLAGSTNHGFDETW